MTLAILILSEIIPKTIGANNRKSLATQTAGGVFTLIWILRPFVWVSQVITRPLKKEDTKSVFIRGDFAAMTDIVGETGQIERTDHTPIKNVLAFDELTAEDIMTPRTVMIMADESDTLDSFYQTPGFKTFSRFSVY